MKKMTALQALTQGLTFNKKNLREKETKKVEKYTVESEYVLSERHMEIINKELRSIDTYSKLRSKEIQEGKTEEERKAMNRFSEKAILMTRNSKMKLKGEGIPLPIFSFSDLHLRYDVPEIFAHKVREMKCDTPTPIQSQAIPVILKKRNCICIAPTGSGKTICFLLPVLINLFKNLQKDKKCGKKAIIIAPTFELSLQIYSVALAIIGRGGEVGGLKASHIQKFSTDDLDSFKEQIEDVHLLVSTPLKFVQVADLGFDLACFEQIVFDEADKYFDLSFMEQFSTILGHLKENKDSCYYLFSATFPQQIENQLKDLFVDAIEVVIRGKMVVLDTIKQELMFTGTEFGKLLELKNIINDGKMDIPCLIFVQSKQRVRELFGEIKNIGIPVAEIRSNMSKGARRRVVEEFTEEKKWILITTDLLARGLDFPKVKLVINYDVPTSMVTYVHRVGRTGRAGFVGKAYTFFTTEDKGIIRSLADLLRTSGCDVPEWIFKIRKTSKKDLRMLKKRPPKRDTISTKPIDNRDWSFKRKMKKMDAEYLAKVKNAADGGKIDRFERDPQVYLAKEIKEIMRTKGDQEDPEEEDEPPIEAAGDTEPPQNQQEEESEDDELDFEDLN